MKSRHRSGWCFKDLPRNSRNNTLAERSGGSLLTRQHLCFTCKKTTPSCLPPTALTIHRTKNLPRNLGKLKLPCVFCSRDQSQSFTKPSGRHLRSRLYCRLE